jgi:glucokinase
LLPKNRQLIGVNIGVNTITVCRFDSSCSLLSCFEQTLPQPEMPGAVTVQISEAIDLSDKFYEAMFVGIAFPGEIDSLGKVVETCIQFPGWSDVPLAYWLEPRLSRKVLILNSAAPSFVSQTLKMKNKTINDDILCSLAAAILSLEQFNSCVDLP